MFSLQHRLSVFRTSCNVIIRSFLFPFLIPIRRPAPLAGASLGHADRPVGLDVREPFKPAPQAHELLNLHHQQSHHFMLRTVALEVIAFTTVLAVRLFTYEVFSDGQSCRYPFLIIDCVCSPTSTVSCESPNSLKCFTTSAPLRYPQPLRQNISANLGYPPAYDAMIVMLAYPARTHAVRHVTAFAEPIFALFSILAPSWIYYRHYAFTFSEYGHLSNWFSRSLKEAIDHRWI